MKISVSVVSDLHLEFDPAFRFPTEGDLLLCCGDIGVVETLPKLKKDRLEKAEMKKYTTAKAMYDFFEDACSKYDRVAWIMGNHEYYGSFIEDGVSIAREHIQFPNLHILDNEYFDYNGYRIVGSTLWTDLNRNCPITEMTLKGMMNDYHLIRTRDLNYRKFQPFDSYKIHKKSLPIISELIKDQDKVIMMSHHAPSSMSVHERFKDDHHMNGGYFSSLEEFILDHPQITNWFHGHVHNCFDYDIGSTRVMANPKGYHNENPQFNPNFLLEI